MKGKVLNISLTFSKCTWLYFNKSYTFKIVDYHNDPLILLELRVNPIRQGLSSRHFLKNNLIIGLISVFIISTITLKEIHQPLLDLGILPRLILE